MKHVPENHEVLMKFWFGGRRGNLTLPYFHAVCRSIEYIEKTVRDPKPLLITQQPSLSDDI
jgi:hypothetical protein